MAKKKTKSDGLSGILGRGALGEDDGEEMEFEGDGNIVVEEQKKPKEKKKSMSDHITNGQSLVNRNYVVIPVGPSIDVMLGGGVPEGSFVIPTGPPKLGKTVLSLTIAANGQKAKYASEFDPTGRDVYFYNIEGRLKRRDLLGIHGLSLERFHVVESLPGHILSAEDFIEIGEQNINEKPGAIHIFDSFSQLCTKARRDSDVRDRFRDDTSLLLATFCKRICNVVPVNRCIVIGITHKIANQGGGPYAPKTTEASGNKIQYEVDVKMNGQYKKPWKSAEGVLIGQEVYWKCESSAIGPPGECMSRIRYGYGIDKEAELVELAGDFGLITKGGSWYTFPDDTKVQGLDAARNILVAKPELYDDVYSKLRTMLGMKDGM